MVKGIAKQVIVVRPRGNALFEEAVFILRENAQEVSQDALLREAGLAASGAAARKPLQEAFSFVLGGGFVGIVWLLCALI